MNSSQSIELTVVMLSQLGPGDGGRETWLLNFLTEIARQKRPIQVHAIHRSSAGAPTMLELPAIRGMVASVRTVPCSGARVPVSLEFLVALAWARIRGRLKARGILIAVGGLSEALAAVILRAGRGGRSSCVLWLRTIYSKEKAAQIPKPFRKTLLALELAVIRRCFGLVLANGDDTAAFYREHGIDCVVIKNAIPLAMWHMARPTLGPRIRVAFIGRLSEVKGIHAFLDAVEMASTVDNPNRFEFVVAGEGPYRGRVQSLEQAGLLSYRGQLDNAAVVGLVAQVDCCVALTYLSDELGGGGVSNALIEQMAAGRIIVAWDNAIFQGVVDKSCSYLVPQGNVSALVAALVAIDEDRESALAKARAAIAASCSYSIEAHVDRFFEVLENRREVRTQGPPAA